MSLFLTLFDDVFNPMQVLEGKTHYLEFFGNLLPVTKSGDQLSHKFYAFRENRLPFNVRVRDPNNDAVGKPTTWDIISESVLENWIRGIRMFLALQDPDPLVRCMDPDPSLFS